MDSDSLSFEWDEKKNQINQKKHGVSFEEAKNVFYDDDAIIFDDPDHSVNEERFLILGICERDEIRSGIKIATYEMLCIVSHCYRDKDGVIRIISARKATPREKKIYNQHSWR